MRALRIDGGALMSYGVMTDYEYGATHKRERITVWSPPFASVFEAEGYSLPKRDGYSLTTYNGDRLIVRTGGVRRDDNFCEVDRLIAEALVAHYAQRGDVALMAV